MDMLNPAALFLPEIRECLQQKDLRGLRTLAGTLNPIDLADIFTQFKPEEQIILFRVLDARRQMIVFEELDLLQQEYLIHHFDDAHLAGLVEGLTPGSLRRLIRKLPERDVRRMEQQLKQGQAQSVLSARTYSPSSLGALIDTDILTLKPEMTSREAVDYLRSRMKVRRDQPVQAVYVTNNAGHPIGALSLRSLIASPVDAQIRELMTPASLIRLPATMDREEAAKTFAHYKLMTAPVVDEENRLIGQIGASDIVRVIQQEDTEDIQKQAGMEVMEEPYFKVSLFKLIRKRGSWLSVLFIGEMLTATAMTYFEKEIARAVVLALFVPLIISSGGNSGSQAATLIVRAMALREITFGDWWKVMRREFAVGLSLGLLLGTLGFLRIFIWSQVTPLYGPHYILLALTVGIALVLVVLWGSLTGSLLPILLRKLGLDPAVVSAPFVATLVDVTGLVIYFVTGLLLLKGTLL